jgi:poly(A) polymerase
MDNKRFRAGYDFLLLREDAGEIESGLGSWWTVFQGAKDEAQKEMVIDVESSQKRSSKKIRNNS